MLSHRLTLVVAAAGWGKTSLLRDLVEATRSIEVSQPPGGWTPFGMARAIVDVIREQSGGGAEGLLPRSPSAHSADGGELQAAALAAALGEAARQLVTQDTIVVLDDAEWPPDDPLTAFLEALVLHLPRRLHLVVATRSAPPMRIARLRAAGEVARLGAEDLAVRLADLDELPAGGHRELLAEIVTATGGWPLAVHLASEALRHDASLARGQLVDRLLAPDAVLFDYLAHDVVTRLGDTARELLGLIGRVGRLSPGLLTDLGRDDLAAALAGLEAGRIFVEPVPNDAGHSQVTLIGREFVARALPPPAPELLEAVVLAAAGRGDVDDAVSLCADLGSAGLARQVLLAADQHRLLETPRLLAAALAVAESDGAATARLTELRGDLHRRTGDWDGALAAYAAAARSSPGPVPRLISKQAGILYLRGALDDADDLCASVVLDGTSPSAEAWVLAWRAVICWTRGDTEGCDGFVGPALDRATRSGDDAALAMAHTAAAMLAALRGDLPANMRSYQRALDHAERAGDVDQIVRIRANRGSRFNEEGRYAEALTEFDEAIRLAELAGSDAFAALAYNNRGETHIALGNVDDALAALRQAEAIWTKLGSERVLYALANLATVHSMRGLRTQAEGLFREAVRLAESRGDRQGAASALVGLARALELDHPEEAAVVAQRAIATGQAIWLPHALTTAGSIALRTGDRTAAAEWAIRAVASAVERRDRPALAEALLLQALVGEPPSESIAEEAGRLWDELGSPIGRARADLVIAQAVPGRGGVARAARAERVLYDAGALGYLADARLWRRDRARAPVAFYTLGGFRVLRDGQPVDVGEWGSRKARDLVKLLIARRGAPVVREEAAELLWPDSTDGSTRRLSVLLSTIRSVLDPAKAHPPDHYVNADHDTVWLVRDHAEIDVELFISEAAEGRRLLAAGDHVKAREVLADAAARYVGDFCADDPYVDWLAGIRELAKHTFVDTSFELAGLAGTAGEHSEAIRHWLRILDVDPYDEDAHVGMIRSLLAQRRHGEARRAYRTYCARLAELDIEPMAFPG